MASGLREGATVLSCPSSSSTVQERGPQAPDGRPQLDVESLCKPPLAEGVAAAAAAAAAAADDDDVDDDG
eukprot:974754-Pelagomonas_calceolata.AAC.1